MFKLGLSSDAEKYIQQYVKIFTEEGRRAVNIRHNLLEIHSNNSNGENSNIGTLNRAATYSTIKKPLNMSCVSTGVQFQSLYQNKTPFVRV